MTLHTRLTMLRAAALLSTCLLAAPAVLAQAMPPAEDHDAGPGVEQADGPFEPRDAFPPFGPGLHAGPPFLRGLDLSEAQQDRVFAILHAQALGQAIADQELLRLRTNAQLKALLTPEQRARLDRPRGEGRKGRADKNGARAKQREAAK